MFLPPSFAAPSSSAAQTVHMLPPAPPPGIAPAAPRRTRSCRPPLASPTSRARPRHPPPRPRRRRRRRRHRHHG
eukprot:303662-Chlamydomonas_euryale.AAC.1